MNEDNQTVIFPSATHILFYQMNLKNICQLLDILLIDMNNEGVYCVPNPTIYVEYPKQKKKWKASFFFHTA